MNTETHKATSAEFILRVRVPIALADKVQDALEPLARRLGGKLSRVERADFPDYSLHLRRKRIVPSPREQSQQARQGNA
jgi:hypothetical protein